MNENEGQVESTVENQAEAVQDQVEETSNVIEQVGQLLRQDAEDNQNVETNETQEAIQEVQQEESEAKSVEVGIIDDTMIQEYPALKMYKGKPIKDLGKAYQNIVKAYTESQKQLKQLEQEKAKQSLPKPTEVPDPVEKPEEFNKWLADYTDKIKQSVQPQPQPRDIVSEVATVLPKDADVTKVVNEWTNFNAERIFNEFGEIRPEVQAFYDRNPHILIGEIKSFYDLSSKAMKNTMTIQTEAKNQAYKTVTNSIKKANQNKEDVTQAQFNQISRTEQLTAEDALLANIYKIAQGG